MLPSSVECLLSIAQVAARNVRETGANQCEHGSEDPVIVDEVASRARHEGG